MAEPSSSVPTSSSVGDTFHSLEEFEATLEVYKESSDVVIPEQSRLLVKKRR